MSPEKRGILCGSSPLLSIPDKVGRDEGGGGSRKSRREGVEICSVSGSFYFCWASSSSIPLSKGSSG